MSVRKTPSDISFIFLQLQISAMGRGIAAIIPSHLLPIFTWQQLELRVCGREGVDINHLKNHTQYRGIKSDDKIVADFWQVLQGFSPDEQCLFIRFVWGRSRLPLESEFTTDFQLQVTTTSFFLSVERSPH